MPEGALATLVVEEEGEVSPEELRDVADEDLIRIGQTYLDNFGVLKKNFESTNDKDDFFVRFATAHNKTFSLRFDKLPTHLESALLKAAESVDGLNKLVTKPTTNVVSASLVYHSGHRKPSKWYTKSSNFSVTVRTNQLLHDLIEKQDKTSEVQQAISETLRVLLQVQTEMAKDVFDNVSVLQNSIFHRFSHIYSVRTINGTLYIVSNAL
ncbi:hypothetical protein [Alicyclobacillus suci]|uniref:hypothetical protein n=1 Tax=Alicyclobacillus suci TaxID=2816080 RepID=UPI001A9023B9|nr:hypothetical protein [Alicyclobacillus suci]